MFDKVNGILAEKSNLKLLTDLSEKIEFKQTTVEF